MNNADYWKQRFTQLETAQHRKGATAYLEMERQYKEAQRQLEGQIARWYQRFADNNGISLAQAKQWLKGDDLAEFKWDVKAYIQHGKENAINGAWMQELENASAKYHISKLEALKIQTQNSLETMFAKQFGTMKKTLSDVYATGYYHTAYEVQRGFKIGWDIAGLDQAQIEKVLAKPWAVDGYNFSERIWGNKTKLISEVHNELSQNIMLGADPQKAIDSLAKKMNTSKNNAGRLVMTEEAYFSSAAQKDCFKSLDVEQYEIVATLDSHTSDICRNLDGKHFPTKDHQPGVTAPPFHVGCRSTTVPYFDEQFDIGERAASGTDGKTYYVPADMTYKEWEDQVVNKNTNPISKQIHLQPVKDITQKYLDSATPQKGNLQYSEGYRIGGHQEEISIAGYLHNTFGGDFLLLSESPIKGQVMPDYQWNGRYWELKSAVSVNSADKSMQKAMKQIQENPGGIILNLLQDIDLSVLENQLERRFRRGNLEELDLILLSKGKLVKVLKYKK